MRKISFLEAVLFASSIVLVTAAVVLFADPARQAAEVNNAKRRQDVETIAAAVSEYALYHPEALPPSGSASLPQEICRIGTEPCASGIDFSFLVDEGYLTRVPTDPVLLFENASTGYVVTMVSGTRLEVTVAAPHAELGQVITAVR